MPHSSRAFRPEWWLLAFGSAAFALLAAIAAGIGAASEQPGALGLGLAVAALLIWLAVRALRMRVEFDEERLTVVGVFRTRSIARDQVVDVDRSGDLSLPSVTWIDAGGRRRWTPMWALQLETSGPFALTALVMRRRRFLDQLAGWARVRGRGPVHPAVAAAVGGAEKAMSNPWVRYASAGILWGIVVALYAWSWGLTLDLVDAGEVPRRFGSTFALAWVLSMFAVAILPRLSEDLRLLLRAIMTVLCVAPFVFVLVVA